MSYVFKIKALDFAGGELSGFSEWIIIPTISFVKIYFSTNNQSNNVSGFGLGLKWLRFSFYVSFMIKNETRIKQIVESEKSMENTYTDVTPEILDIGSILNSAPKLSIAKTK